MEHDVLSAGHALSVLHLLIVLRLIGWQRHVRSRTGAERITCL